MRNQSFHSISDNLLYSIKDLERISGIKAHTLRIWEKRYDILTPERTDTNIRMYGDDDLRKLLNVKSLLDSGWKISHVGELTQEELQSEVKKSFEDVRAGAIDYTLYINALVSAMFDLNEPEFDRVFASATTRLGLKETVMKVVNPFLQQVGLMWSVWEVHPGHEHFASNIIRRKLFAAIDQLIPLAKLPKKFLLFLPEGEDHEIGLLFANYWLRSEGYEVIYLGQNVPFEALTQVVGTKAPDCLLTFFISNRLPEELNDYMVRLTAHFETQNIYVAGEKGLLEQLENHPKIIRLYQPEDLLNIM